jgi:hypothetical protein
MKSRCPPLLLPLVVALGVVLGPVMAFATDWTPLIDPSDFDGLRTDVMTMCGGIISIALIVVGLAYLVRTLSK